MGWCVWTAILAAMPYGVRSFGPLVPGQIGITAFALATMLFVAVSLLAPHFEGGRRSSIARVQGVLMRVGWVATAGLAVAESYAFVRGDGYLYTDSQIAAEYAFALLEFLCSGVAVLCWALSSVSPDVQRDAFTPVRLIGIFAAGGSCPTLCALVASASALDSAFTSTSLCVAVFALALWGALRWHKTGCSSWDVSALLAGHMAFLALRSFVGEYRSDLLDAGLPDAAFYGVFLAFVVGLSLALLARVRWVGGEREGGSGPLVRGEHSEGDVSGEHVERRMEQRLAKAARSSLTEREAAVLARTALGATAVSIAAELGLAQATVATYRHRGYEKLGVGGARELRKLAAGLDLNEEPLNAGEVVPVSCERGAVRSHASLGPQAIALGLVVLVLLLDTTNNVQIGERWYHRGTFYLTWTVSCALAVVSFVRMASFRQVALSPRDEQGPLGFTVTTILSLVVACLLSAGSFCGWSGMWLYKIWGPVLLVVASLVVGRAFLPRTGDTPSFWRVLFGGFGVLLASPLLPLLGSAGIAVTYYFELYFSGFVTDWIYVLFPLSIFLTVVALVYLMRTAAVSIAEPTEREHDRAMHYLQSRGVDGLRAQIVIDLVCGYSALEVCERRCTTLATVKSYRQRTYDDCKVHCMNDLRKLLMEEVGFTSLERLHPQK